MPTTKAQVSGHRFLRRRVEHGLVMGDIRMIHDPLATRKRALTFGGIAVGLVAAGSGLLAWLQPNAAPGEAPVLRSSQGQLFVRVDETLHPVANLASARIIAGESAQPASIGDSHLEQSVLGSPVGITDAPGFLAMGGATGVGDWSACFAGEIASEEGEFPTVIDDSGEVAAGETVVAEGLDVRPLQEKEAAFAHVDGDDWLITPAGRAQLPAADTTEGRVMRRVLGVDQDVHLWRMPPEVLNTYPELPALEFPGKLPAVVDTNKGAQGLWALTGTGEGARVWRLTETQATMLVDMGAELRTMPASEVAEIPSRTPEGNLPGEAPSWVNPDSGWLCATPSATAGETAAVARPVGGTVALSGTGVADRFVGLDAGGVGVDTGNGYQVVSATGQRHAVDSPAVLNSLGVGAPHPAPWSIIRLLPEGTALSREEALKVTY